MSNDVIMVIPGSVVPKKNVEECPHCHVTIQHTGNVSMVRCPNCNTEIYTNKKD